MRTNPYEVADEINSSITRYMKMIQLAGPPALSTTRVLNYLRTIRTHVELLETVITDINGMALPVPLSDIPLSDTLSHTRDSSNIDRVDYQTSTRSLFAYFRGGSKYVFSDVPPTTFHQLTAAPSLGKAFSLLIRDKFEFKRIPT